MTRRRLLKIVTVACALAVVWICWLGYAIWSFGELDHARHSDCAIVLGAAVYGDRASPVFEQRIRHAISLYQRNVVPAVLFTGGHGAGAAYAESQVAAEYAINAGVAETDILIETRSRTTRENLKEAKAVMDAHGLRSAVIVSDPLHLKRAAIMARDLEISAVTSPTATTRYRSVKTRFGFLLREIYFFHHYLVTGD